MEIGDEVLFTARDTEWGVNVTGWLAEEIVNQCGGRGWHIVTSEVAGAVCQGTRTVRVWEADGTLTATGRTLREPVLATLPPPVVPVAAAEPYQLPYRSAGDLAAEYRVRGLDRHRAWAQFIKDTILLRCCRSETMNARAFFRLYNNPNGAA